MTAWIHSPQRDCVSPIGIPVDNLTMQDALVRIIAMVRRRDGTPRLVSTLNVDFIVNAIGLRSSSPTHPELLHILRRSDLVTADGFPIVWLSRLVGRPLTERVCGSDLVPALAERCAKEHLSFFLLGGAHDVGKRAANRLTRDYPGLTIAGTAAPMIHTSGPERARSEAEDVQLVDQINRSGADILLLGLGNPKQELWFHRNRHRLTVPVSIGVGGTFAFLAGEVKRAPRWVQSLNMEWVYRITQDPARLWRRYAKGVFKLAYLSLPLLWHRTRQALMTSRNEQWELRIDRVCDGKGNDLRVVRMPRLVTQSQLQQLLRRLRNDSQRCIHRLDFSKSKGIEMAGQAALFALSELQKHRAGHIQIVALSSALRRQLRATRLLDLIDETAVSKRPHSPDIRSIGAKS